MKTRFAVILLAVAAMAGTAHATDLKISGISISAMKKSNLCSAIGGKNAPPTITIRHSRVAGVSIRVRMFDTVSNGNLVDHYSTTVKSKASGKTQLKYRFRPPCNTTGNSVSTYRIEASAGKSRKRIIWGRYDSVRRRISR